MLLETQEYNEPISKTYVLVCHTYSHIRVYIRYTKFEFIIFHIHR